MSCDEKNNPFAPDPDPSREQAKELMGKVAEQMNKQFVPAVSATEGKISPAGRNDSEKKFPFELSEKEAKDLQPGEVVFVPEWENDRWFAEDLGKIIASVPQEEYQKWVANRAQKFGYVVKQGLEKAVVLFPINRARLNNRVLNGLHRIVISTGKILQVEDAGN